MIYDGWGQAAIALTIVWVGCIVWAAVAVVRAVIA